MNEFCSSDCELKGILAKCHAVCAQDLGALMEVSWVHSSPLGDVGSDTELLQDLWFKVSPQSGGPQGFPSG